MNIQTNPFYRGYSNLRIQRLMFVRNDNMVAPRYLPLHASQQHLRNHELRLKPCLFGDDFVLVDKTNIPDEVNRQCPHRGEIISIAYFVFGERRGKVFLVAQLPTEGDANELCRDLSFDTGHFSRCWEISSGHITPEAFSFLENLADDSDPCADLFEAFWVRECHGVGVKLMVTPWDDQNLKAYDDITPEVLRLAQANKGVPESLIKVLHLAALADTRILIFDPFAPELKGLPTYRW